MLTKGVEGILIDEAVEKSIVALLKWQRNGPTSTHSQARFDFEGYLVIQNKYNWLAAPGKKYIISGGTQ